MFEIEKWAKDNLSWYKKMDNKDRSFITGILVKYYIFIDDFKIYVKTCNDNPDYTSVMVRAEARMGYKDFDVTLGQIVQDLYNTLNERYESLGHLFYYCVNKHEVDNIIKEFSNVR